MPILTPDFVARAEVTALLNQIGINPTQIPFLQSSDDKQYKSAKDAFNAGFAPTPSNPAKHALSRLFELVKDPDAFVTPERVRSILIENAEQIRTEVRHELTSRLGKIGAAARHAGHSAAKERIRAIWAEGNFETRGICAEEECGTVGLKYDAARKALMGTPDPEPWPAKSRK